MISSPRLPFVTRRLRPAFVYHLLPGRIIAGGRLTLAARWSLRAGLFAATLMLVALSGWRLAKAVQSPATIMVNSTADAQLSEVQQVTVAGSGTFTLTFNGQTTSSLMTSSFFLGPQMEGALNALSSIGGVGGRTYVARSGSVYLVTFGGTLVTTNVPQMTVTNAGGSTTSASTTFDGTPSGCPANCTLRGAIAAANAGDTVQFSSLFNSPQTITLTAGDLAVDEDLTIQGPGANLLTVSGNQASRVFLIPSPLSPDPPLNVAISGLTIANGNATSLSDNFGGIGGGIYNGGNLTLTNTAVSSNSSPDSQGGGIAFAPSAATTTTMNIIGSTLNGNTATQGQGGGIVVRCNTACVLNLTNSTMAGNAAVNGGGIGVPLNGNITINITNSTIVGNSASNANAADGVDINVPFAKVSAKNSIIALNTGTDVFNGGVFVSQGDNVIGTISSAFGVLVTLPSDQLGANPGVELDGMSNPKLASNGGPTQTVRLLPGSPALDKGASAVYSEAQLLTVSGSAGTFTLTFNGQTTNAMPFNATATLVQMELNNLSTIGGVGGSVAVGKASTRFAVLFGGALAGADQPLMTAAGIGGTTASVSGMVDGGTGSPLTTDQRGLARPVNLPGVPDAAAGNGSDIGAFEVQCASITISPASLPAATVGAAYTQNLTASGGGAPYTFTVTAGSTPPGLTLNSDGTWSGAPTTADTSNFTVTAQDGFGCGVSQTYSLSVVCPIVSLTPATLPSGQAGTAYSQQLSATGGSFSFSLTSGVLPAGLSLSPSGSLSGTPTQSGTFSFRVTAAFGSCSGFRDYTLTVACGSIDLTPASLPGGTVGTAYNQTVSGTPGGTYAYSVTSGALPPGLTLNAATGQIIGTPTTTGSFNFTITATAGACTGSRGYSVAIACPSISFTTTSPLPAGNAGVAYSQTLNVTPAGSYTFSLVSGGLPSGLVLNGSTGVISGTPAVTGITTFTVKAQAATGCNATQSYTLTINCPSLTLAPGSLPSGTAGTAYSQTIAASPAGGSYTYSVTSGSLPPGLNLNVATGVLSGAPTTNGTSTFTITATGFGGCTGSQAYTVVISGGGGCATITLPASLPNGSIGQLYNTAAAASPAGLYTYTASGSLPMGTTLFSFNGLIFGYPTAMGSYTFTITATAGTCSASQTYTVLIGAGMASSLTVFSDFDGDGKSDLAVWRGSDGNWLVAASGNGQLQTTPWGASSAPYNDVPVSGDYDGDGKTDLAVFRRGDEHAGYWFIKRSSDGQVSSHFWGLGTDVPVPGDYDGDRKTDVAVWRGSAGGWYIVRSSDGGVDARTWGFAPMGDVPVPGDYDGDGKTDLAVYRRSTGEWFIKRSSDNLMTSAKWGVGTDVPVPGDYDGDNRTDIAVWRGSEGHWYIVQSSNAIRLTVALGAGAQGDVPVAGDYDGDGKADPALWQASTGTWTVRRSSDDAVISRVHGQSGDAPVAARRH